MKVMEERLTLYSSHLLREVVVDCFFMDGIAGPVQLLLLNDGQQAPLLDLPGKLAKRPADKALLIAAIHAGPQRLQEYGTARVASEKGQGLKATAYTRCVVREVLPFLAAHFATLQFDQKNFAGFSLGALSALDIVWQYPGVFRAAGVFSGALWWRNHALGEGYSDAKHRIIHQLVQQKGFQPGLRFFFECGTDDEKADRNGNGVIDMIDDTQDLISILKGLGYTDIKYLEIKGGRHDEATWSKALEPFLDWL